LAATSAVIPASGLGKRLNSETDKAFVPLAGQPLIAHALAVFQDCSEIEEIVLVVRAEQVGRAGELARERGFAKVKAVVPGGEARQDSVRSGLAEVSPGCDVIAVHDGARPLITREIIASSIDAARADGAAIAAVPVTDTIKSSLDGRFVRSTLDRERLYAVQTPQTFAREVIESAYERAYADRYFGTDDASLVERLGLPVRIVQGSYENIKVTTPTDIAIAEAIMRARAEGSRGQGIQGLREGAASDVVTSPAVCSLQSAVYGLSARVGQGYDIHRFGPGRKLFLGGIEFPGEEGLLGHSDADVMLHAVADAVLGAAGAGDIGRLFPDTDPAYKDIRSTVLLARVAEVVVELGWRVGNVDVTLVAERPRIAKHAPAMQANIAEALRIAPEQVGVKASTAEGLGPIGEGLGIECYAVALLCTLE